MPDMNASASNATPPSKGLLMVEGMAFVLVGILAIAFPAMMTVALEQFLGILCVILGVVTLGSAFGGKAAPHRFSPVLSGIVLLGVGLVLLVFVRESIFLLTVLLAVLFFAEGAFSIATALRRRASLAGWPMLLFNGVLALLIGVMIVAQWPLSGAWAIGLLYGINMLFAGIAILAVASSGGPPAAAEPATD